MVALVTPFRDDDTVDEEALRALVEEQIRGGTDALIPCGTTGEVPTLSFEEKQTVFRIVVEQTQKRVPVIAGVGGNDTRASAQLAATAREAGADAVMVVTPFYNKPTPDGLLAHYREIARAGKREIVLYHVPGRTGLSLSPETLIRIAREVPEVTAVKEASGYHSFATLQACYPQLSGKVAFLCGEDNLTLPFLAAGGEGVISVTANVAPERVAAVYDLFTRGELDKARAAHYALLPLHDAMFLESNPIPVKAALAMMGKIRPNLRLPLAPITSANEAKLRDVLRAQHLLG
jgi:4-hydroxy-tetrahydrodipicolinate synthase